MRIESNVRSASVFVISDLELRLEDEDLVLPEIVGASLSPLPLCHSPFLSLDAEPAGAVPSHSPLSLPPIPLDHFGESATMPPRDFTDSEEEEDEELQLGPEEGRNEASSPPPPRASSPGDARPGSSSPPVPAPRPHGPIRITVSPPTPRQQQMQVWPALTRSSARRSTTS